MNTSLIVGAVIIAQYVLLEIFNYAYDSAEQAVGEVRGLNSSELVPFFIGDLVSEILYALGFAVGVFVSLKVVKPISSSLPWTSAMLRGVLATAFGAVGVFAVHVLEALLGSVKIGPYPFAYSFSASFDPTNFGFDVLNAFGSLINPFIYNVPLVVVACLLLKLWLSRTPAIGPLLEDFDAAPTAPASRAE
jgi:hypothetical protein